MQDIIGKVKVLPGKRAAHVIPLLPPAFCKFLKLRHNQVIAAFPVSERPHPVIDLPPPVKAQHNVIHLLVYEFLYLTVKQHSVRRHRKPKMLVMDLFLLSSVSHQILYHLPVHKRLSAEKVYLEVSAVPGICNQKVKRFLSHIISHERPPPMILSLFGKAVFTGKVAVMGNMQAHSLYHGFSVLHALSQAFVAVFCEQAPAPGKLRHILQRFL